jgi:hypothetical protein
MRKKLIITEIERNRILDLYEQNIRQEITSIPPKKFPLPNNVFASGNFTNLNTSSVDNVIGQLNEYLKEYPQNQQINVEIEASESKVPNQVDPTTKKRYGVGELAEKRSQTLLQYLMGKLPQNVKVTVKNMGAQGPEWAPPKGSTPDQIKQLANDPKYGQYQYVSFNVVGSGQNVKTICEVGFYIIVDYKKEWCKPGVDESRCHKCDSAVFNMWANGIPLVTDNNDPLINLNNNEGDEKSGPSREVRLHITQQQKQRILSVNKDEIIITYNCALYECHSDPAHITIISENGQVLMEPTFVTSGGQRLGKSKNTPLKLLKLTSCGEKIAVFGDEAMGGKPNEDYEEGKAGHYFNLQFQSDEEFGGYGRSSVPTIESMYWLYRFVDRGDLYIPESMAPMYGEFMKYSGRPFSSLLYAYGIRDNYGRDLNYLEKLKQYTAQKESARRQR